ncbi:hypothetical protein [Microbacterium hominis]|nr:hypothetical protein [Microbacterium hominis]
MPRPSLWSIAVVAIFSVPLSLVALIVMIVRGSLIGRRTRA